MSLEDLNELLLDNEITNFDPVAEAFKVRVGALGLMCKHYVL
jgi:hypothetical protein